MPVLSFSVVKEKHEKLFEIALQKGATLSKNDSEYEEIVELIEDIE